MSNFQGNTQLRLPSTSFISKRVNESTFMIVEDDAYGEQPYIYVKIYPKHLLITDTGCNTPRKKNMNITSLLQYIETYPIASNHSQVLNPDGKKSYIIICSHCHYDHILGIPAFLSSSPQIIASASGRSFILHNLGKHSLCKYINVPTPQYTVSHWAENLSYLPHASNDSPFRIQFLNIPGHTPCSLAWYDIDKHHLYVGDTFYERKRVIPIPELPPDAGQVPGLPATQAAIIFPEEGGNWIQYMASLDLLLSFTQYQNSMLRKQHEIVGAGEVKRVLVGCGHLTMAADAEDMIAEVQGLFWRIIEGKVPIEGSEVKRNVVYDFWIEDEDARYSVMAPRHLAEDARKYFGK